MSSLLLIYVLIVESSYLQNLERAAAGATDTIQFCLKNGQAWRIKTFAIDHDVHVWSMGAMTPERMVSIADENTGKNYGDVLGRKISIESQGDGSDLAEQLVRAGLPPFVEGPEDGSFAFWAHAAKLYRTQSSPQ